MCPRKDGAGLATGLLNSENQIAKTAKAREYPITSMLLMTDG